MNADKHDSKEWIYQRSSVFICGLIGFFLSFLRAGPMPGWSKISLL
jgi:hypothetical protein